MKVKKEKKSSALSKAVSNVTQIIKKKDKNEKKEKKDVKKKLKEIVVSKDIKKTTDKKNKKVKVNKKVKKTDKDKEDDIEKPFVSKRGVVYIGHIPYGFFEDEMKEYFEQFGRVTRVRVARSDKTGKSKGYGYIEFLNTDVAKIAAETMHNYLMCGRLLKATYIPPEKQHKGFFAGKPWKPTMYPRLSMRIKELKKNESPISVKIYKKNVNKSLRKLSALEEKLKSKGVNVKFKPADVPS